MCIAGVADQLQTNFAFDLRQILRSVFLMNMSPAHEELDIPEKAKENELFEFRASENDVIQESAGSSQSIYSAEEVNPEGDNQSNISSNSSSSNSSRSTSNGGNRAYRHSTGTTITTSVDNSGGLNENSTITPASQLAVNQRQQIERSRSLDNQIAPLANDNQIQQQQLQQQQQQQHQQLHSQRLQNNQIFRNRYHSTGSNTPSVSSSENSSPVCERSANTANTNTITTTTNRRQSESNANTIQQQQQQHQLTSSSPVHLSPPAWIPDQKAPRCMSCNTPFTAFRRRHHCRNCGGVFCGVCSNTSAPLPKYGLTKAVRVCRACYVHELSSSSETANANATAALNQQQQQQHQQHHHHHHHHHHNHHTAATANGNTTNQNNEPRLRRPVTTTRAID